MSKLIEGISEIISKVEKNISSERLRRGAVDELLDEIKGDLETLGKSAGKEYKETVDKKIEALQEIIKKNLDEEPGWTTTQDDLSKIKKGLVELKNEIEWLMQKQQQQVMSTIQIQRPTFTDAVIAHEKSAMEMMVKGAEKEGILGAAIGAGLGTASVFTTGVAHLAEGFQRDVKDFAEKGIGVGANVYENTRAGAQKVAEQVITEGAGITKQTIKIFDGLGTAKDMTKTLTEGISDAKKVKAKAESDARIAEAQAKAEVAKAEAQARIAEAQAKALEAQVLLQSKK